MNKIKMNAVEKSIWVVGMALVIACDVLVQNQEALAIFKMPAHVVAGAGAISLIIRNVYLKLKDKGVI